MLFTRLSGLVLVVIHLPVNIVSLYIRLLNIYTLLYILIKRINKWNKKYENKKKVEYDGNNDGEDSNEFSRRS